jgi:hypothetical protein
MSRPINSAMDSEGVEATRKYLRLATITSTGSGELFEDFSATLAAGDVNLEDALTEALRLYVDLHPRQ